MFWFNRKKKEKSTEDYYKNELMRSRMSDISLRTDEIIQQYFFVAKDESLNLEEYLRIRELATKELNLIESHRDEVVRISQTEQGFCEEQKGREEHVTVQRECKATNEATSTPAKLAEALVRVAKEEDKTVMEFPLVEKRGSERRPAPVKEEKKKDNEFDLLAIMQSIED